MSSQQELKFSRLRNQGLPKNTHIFGTGDHGKASERRYRIPRSVVKDDAGAASGFTSADANSILEAPILRATLSEAYEWATRHAKTNNTEYMNIAIFVSHRRILGVIEKCPSLKDCMQDQLTGEKPLR